MKVAHSAKHLVGHLVAKMAALLVEWTVVLLADTMVAS